MVAGNDQFDALHVSSAPRSSGSLSYDMLLGGSGSDRVQFDAALPQIAQPPRPKLNLVQQQMVPEGEPSGRIANQVVTAQEMYGPFQPTRMQTVSAPAASPLAASSLAASSIAASSIAAMMTPTVGTGVLRATATSASVDRAMSVDLDWLTREETNTASTITTFSRSNTQASPTANAGFNAQPASWVELQSAQVTRRTQWQDFSARPHLATLPQSESLDTSLSDANALSRSRRASHTNRTLAVRTVDRSTTTTAWPMVESLIMPTVLIPGSVDSQVAIDPESIDDQTSLVPAERSKPVRTSRYWYLAAIPAFFIFQRRKERSTVQFSRWSDIKID